MQGMNVLMPMGWDAFGLPAENAAMKNKVPPAKWTYDNIADMKAPDAGDGPGHRLEPRGRHLRPGLLQVEPVAVPEDAGQAGIADRKTQVVNWDPVDQTVLANEQVIDGRGWRSGALVEKREIPGYYLKITQYADELLANVATCSTATCPAGPSACKLMQENWIGKSEGVRFAFPHDIRGDDGAADQRRPDVRLHDPRRHHHGRDLLRRRARAPAGHARGQDATRRWPPSSKSARRAAPPRPSWRRRKRKACPPA